MKNYFYILLPLLSFSLMLSSDDNHTSHLEKIVLGSGCFWGAEKGYEGLQGVEDAVSGYADGYDIKPTYKEIIKIKNNEMFFYYFNTLAYCLTDRKCR